MIDERLMFHNDYIWVLMVVSISALYIQHVCISNKRTYREGEREPPHGERRARARAAAEREAERQGGRQTGRPAGRDPRG